MGLFTFLKNGLTIEKKKKEVTEPAVEENIEDAVTEEIDEAAENNDYDLFEPTPAVPEPVTPEPVKETIAEKRLEAEYILYGDTNTVNITPPAPKPTLAPTVSAAESVTVNNPVPATATNNSTTSVSQPQQTTYTPYLNNINATFNNAFLGQTVANQNLLVVSPKTPEELSPILSNLVSGNPCIVSLSQIENPQRHLDYMSGFINAIGGTIRQYNSPTEYILTPRGVGIKGN